MIRLLAAVACCLLLGMAAARAQTDGAATPDAPATIAAPSAAAEVAAPPAAAGQATAAAPALEAVDTAAVVRIALILTLMALLPALVISMTSFVRIVVVLSMIRHAFGMPETPPNSVLVSLALFLTLFSMMPTLEAVNGRALQPFLAGQLSVEAAVAEATGPAREFMLRQVRDQDLKAVYDISRKPLPARAEDVELMQLVPAFMLNELRVAFRIGFVVLLPFLLIDLVVSSILLALGMLMVPPSTLSLPIKVLMFVLIDGWTLVLQGVLGSFR
jgi:flagellar biosynthetic protein FliP